MPRQCIFLCKWFAACITFIWFVTSVHSNMDDEVSPLNECLPTHITWFGIGVNLHMHNKVRFLRKWFSTRITRVRFVNSVNSNMTDGVCLRDKCLSTRITWEWFDVGVNLHTHDKVRFNWKLFIKSIIRVRFVTSMHSSMLDEFFVPNECFTTRITWELFVVCVKLHMYR
jgi:hypothetical protein